MFAFLRVLLLCVHLLHFKIITGVDLPSDSGGAGASEWQSGEIKAAPEAGLVLVNVTAEDTINLGADGEYINFF